ncbi:PIN domain-containing protein [Ideonella oryzae]|uniref:PIN domain-containing protein n=1 Tax=Ideonella oryzae TaxID=2937441 RepID=A0ABT1BNI7_9BURK|nr:PIN domain-containing protein [Ideonella oryzae]
MQRVYISDTNIWIDFGNAGLLDALFALPLTFVSTEFVVDELDKPSSAELLARGLTVESLSEEAVAELFELMDQHGNSSLADVSCYLVAKAQGMPLLTGDGRLRKQAAKDGLEVRGALWLLDQLVALHIISTAHAAASLQAMLDAGARLPQADCAHRRAMWLP